MFCFRQFLHSLKQHRIGFSSSLYFKIFLLTFLSFSFPIVSAEAQNRTHSLAEVSALAKEANTYMKENQFEKSLIKARIALTYAIAIKDDNLIASIYNTIGANFDEMGEPDKAFLYYNKGLLYANKTNNYQLRNWLYNNLGNIYCFDKKQYKKGISYYKKSLEYSKRINDSKQILLTNLNIAWAYFDIGSYNEGSSYLAFINKNQKKYGDESTLVALNMLNGVYYANKLENQKAHYYFETAISQGILGDEKSDLSFTYLEYSKFLMKVGQYKKAYENLARFNAITASLNDDERRKKINVAGINLEIDQYKREIDLIEKKYLTNQQIILERQRKNKQISAIIIASLLLIIILFYFFLQNVKLKQNHKLRDIQSKVQDNIISASVSGQEMERKKIATFLHDNISALLSSAGLHLTVHSTKNDLISDEILKTKRILKEAHDKVRDLSHELMPTLLARFGLFYALEDLCEVNSNSALQFSYSSNVNSKRRYNEDFEMKIYFIVTELLNNIIKHSKASNAILTIKEDGNWLKLEIKDNGKGIDTTKYEYVEGFGLNQIQARISTLQGNFAIASMVESGTTIAIEVPILHFEH